MRLAIWLALLCAALLVSQTKPATVADFDWLAGHWTGRFNQADAEEVWTSPRAGTMLVMLRLMRNDRVILYQIGVLLDTKEGVEFRFRHFGPALDAAEKEDPIIMKLVSFDGKKAVFENFIHTRPKRTTFTRTQANEMQVRSEILREGQPPEIHELSLTKGRGND